MIKNNRVRRKVNKKKQNRTSNAFHFSTVGPEEKKKKKLQTKQSLPVSRGNVSEKLELLFLGIPLILYYLIINKFRKRARRRMHEVVQETTEKMRERKGERSYPRGKRNGWWLGVNGLKRRLEKGKEEKRF